jgi:cell pole-organizing protein PopZ
MEAVEAAPEVPQTAPEAVQHEPAQAAGEEAASALERAIAALRAGQPPASTTPQAEPFEFQTTPQADSMEAAEAAPEAGSEPEPVPMAIPMPSPEVEAETHPELDASLEVPGDVDFESQPDEAPVAPMLDEAPEELVLADAELTVIEETVVEAVGEPEVKGPFWPEQAQAEEPVPEAESVLSPEPEPVTAQVNGAEVHHDIEGKTMEDSVKDMLRPMLRQWLDDNMERLIREGFDPETLRRPQD